MQTHYCFLNSFDCLSFEKLEIHVLKIHVKIVVDICNEKVFDTDYPYILCVYSFQYILDPGLDTRIIVGN